MWIEFWTYGSVRIISMWNFQIDDYLKVLVFKNQSVAKFKKHTGLIVLFYSESIEITCCCVCWSCSLTGGVKFELGQFVSATGKHEEGKKPELLEVWLKLLFKKSRGSGGGGAGETPKSALLLVVVVVVVGTLFYRVYIISY